MNKNKHMFISKCHYLYIFSAAPGPLYYVPLGVCISYVVGSWKMVIGDNCDTMFYFDGEYIREASSHRCLSPVSYTNYATIYFTTTCTYAVMFQYDTEESELTFQVAAALSIHSFYGGSAPGTNMIVHEIPTQYTIINKGKIFLSTQLSDMCAILILGIWLRFLET